MSGCTRASFGWAVPIAVPCRHAVADVKIAFIDPLSGGAASTGILAQKTHQFYIDAINASGGLNGEKIELLSFDNKVNPQESLIQLKRALDDGARYVVQGNGSSVALAITDAVLKHNERNPGKEVLFLNYAAVDPALTNEKCNFWHFRFDADADMKMAAMTDVIAKDKKVQKVYLINQDYSFGKAVAAAANKMLAEKRPDIKIVGDELHPLQKVNDFSPYVAKIKAAGADTVITGNWSNDMVLLIKAGKDAGLKVAWETYYGGVPGAVTAIGEAGVDTMKQVTEWHRNAAPELDATVGGVQQEVSGQGERVRVLAREDDVGDGCAAAKEGRLERSREGRAAMEGMKMQDTVG
jgi:branched-chain amino acid transport system substrate-binding protein